MSKGEPIKLSTTHFVLYAQSFRNWLGKLMHGDGKTMGVKFKFGKPPIFGNVFLTSLASKCLGMHAHHIMDPYILFSHAVGATGALPFTFS